MRKLTILALFLAFALTIAGCGISIGDGFLRSFSGNWTDIYEFTPDHLIVESTNGFITVETWDRDEVKVDARFTARTRAYQFSPIVVENGSSLSLSLPQDRNLTGVSWTLRVPKGLNITAKTSNGRVEILGEGYKKVTAKTSNGRLVIDGSGEGQLYARTSNGSVDIADWAGEVDVSTSNGNITAYLGRLESGQYKLTSSNGRIKVFVAEDSAFDLTASTSNGRIESDLKGSWSQVMSGRDYQGQFNKGGASLILSTSNSNIILQHP